MILQKEWSDKISFFCGVAATTFLHSTFYTLHCIKCSFFTKTGNTLNLCGGGDFRLIKGVNKQIIEVQDTGNKYFEKAVLYLNPEYSSESLPSLKKKADRLIGAMGVPPRQLRRDASKRRRTRRFPIFFLFFCGYIFAVLCYILYRVIF